MPGCCSLHKHHQAAAKAAKSIWFPTEEGSPVCPPQFVRPEAGMEEPGAPALGSWLCHAAPPPQQLGMSGLPAINRLSVLPGQARAAASLH